MLWQALMTFSELLRDRARRFGRDSYKANNGDTFANSVDFPPALVASLSRTDPKALLFSSSPVPKDLSSISSETKAALISRLTFRVGNKQVLVQSGAVDKLVPYDCSKPFLDFLKHITGPAGWFEGKEGLLIDDRVYEGVGHRFTDGMMDDAVKWIAEVVGRSDRGFKPEWERKGGSTTGSSKSYL